MMASVLVQRGEKMLLDNPANSSTRVLDRMEQLSGKRQLNRLYRPERPGRLPIYLIFVRALTGIRSTAGRLMRYPRMKGTKKDYGTLSCLMRPDE